MHHEGPPLLINIDQVECLRDVGYTHEQVAGALGVSRTTLFRHLQEENVSFSSFSDISDSDLDDQVMAIQHNVPNAGLLIIQGHLQSAGVSVQRQRVRDAVARTDPIHRKIRWHQEEHTLCLDPTHCGI